MLVFKDMKNYSLITTVVITFLASLIWELSYHPLSNSLQQYSQGSRLSDSISARRHRILESLEEQHSIPDIQSAEAVSSSNVSPNVNRMFKEQSHVLMYDARDMPMHHAIVQGARAAPDNNHIVKFMVKQRNMDELTRIVHDISDPTSQNYGNHLTHLEVKDLTSNPESRDQVVAYLEAAGVSIVSVKHWGQTITALAPVSLWEDILDTEFHSFSVQSPRTDGEGLPSREFLRSKTYSLPKALAMHIDSVLNTVQMPDVTAMEWPVLDVERKSRRSLKAKTPVFFNTYLTVASINKRYEIEDNTGHPLATQTAIAMYGYQFCPEDLRDFQTKFNTTFITPTVSTENEQFVKNAQWCYDNYPQCVEPSLDNQLMMGIANNPTIIYASESQDYSQIFLGLIEQKAATSENPPYIINLSYGINERYITTPDALIFQDVAIKYAAMGCTIIVSAGDDGVTGRENRINGVCGYETRFPVSCPYILAVGSTQVSALKCSE
jgi:tripeptidyl-peptidase I